LLPFLTARAFFRDPLGYVRGAGGDGIVRFAAPGGRYVLVRDPDAIWRVLVSEGDVFRPGKWKRRARRFVGDTLNTLHGEQHRERRMLLQPSVARRRVQQFAPGMAERAERAVGSWPDGGCVTLRDELDPLCLAMAGDVLLSRDLAPEAPALTAALRAIMAAAPRLTPPVAGTRQGAALTEMNRRIAVWVAERRESGGHGDDLLGVLLAGGLAGEVVRGEILAFLLAAVDEPPSGLEAAAWLLGRHPAEQEGLGDEQRLDAVIRESLRLFPPARHIDRVPAGDVTIAGCPVAAGTNVVVSPFVTHHDPRLYDDPGAFAPRRWAEGDRGHRRGAYVPFGAGVHTCIGEPLAREVMRATLAAITRRWRLHVDPGAPAPVPGAPRLVVSLEARR
jgi:cytochrome P450